MTHYTVLGVEPAATPEELKAAYRARIRALHPDVGGNNADAAAVNEAYRVLRDPVLRYDYDRQLANPAPDPTPAPTPAPAASDLPDWATAPAARPVRTIWDWIRYTLPATLPTLLWLAAALTYTLTRDPEYWRMYNYPTVIGFVGAVGPGSASFLQPLFVKTAIWVVWLAYPAIVAWAYLFNDLSLSIRAAITSVILGALSFIHIIDWLVGADAWHTFAMFTATTLLATWCGAWSRDTYDPDPHPTAHR